MTNRIGFIGLGIMGKPMAGHLLRAGNLLVVHSRTKTKADELLTGDAVWADSPAEVARQCDVVFICVTDTPDVEAVVSGPTGILSQARQGMIVVDHSTISPSATRKMAEKLKARGATLLDAPVSGGDVGARNATLSIMVGGAAAAFARVEPLLRVMGKTITHCGPSGAGQLTKLTNQILVTINNLATCEALTFAQRNGLDPQKTIAALGAGAAGSWQWSNLGPRMVAGDFAPGFMVDLQVKDLRLVLQSAEESGVDPLATKLVFDLFSQAQQTGMGLEGTQALFKVVRERESK